MAARTLPDLVARLLPDPVVRLLVDPALRLLPDPAAAVALRAAEFVIAGALGALVGYSVGTVIFGIWSCLRRAPAPVSSDAPSDTASSDASSDACDDASGDASGAQSRGGYRTFRITHVEGEYNPAGLWHIRLNTLYASAGDPGSALDLDAPEELPPKHSLMFEGAGLAPLGVTVDLHPDGGGRVTWTLTPIGPNLRAIAGTPPPGNIFDATNILRAILGVGQAQLAPRTLRAAD